MMLPDDLIVQRPTETDTGVYECRASNAAGTHVDSVVAQIAGDLF